MGQYLMKYPDIHDADLVFDDQETKQILSFFYPSYSSRITALSVTDDSRRLAQTMLIAAIDASNDLSYVKTVAVSLRLLPGKSVASWAKKLAKGLAKQWFKNTAQKDLLKAEVYESARASIALACVTHFQAMLNGIARARLPSVRYAHIGNSNIRWG